MRDAKMLFPSEPHTQVRIAAAVCTFLMKSLVVSKKCLIFAA